MNSYFENMHPRFLRVADETETILRETFKFLVKSKASTSLQQQVDAMTANVSRSLNKAAHRSERNSDPFTLRLARRARIFSANQRT